MNASIREEIVTFPTYTVFPPEKSPLFIEKRAYQGSTGKVYPMPVTEKISSTKKDMPYHAVILENEYMEVMVLPELGGRIHRALDKTNNYDFVYFNHVVKPALVGLAGPWISGGIEFNWPQHHRPSTFSPVDYTTKQYEDGSVSVFVGEIDKMYGTKGMAEIRLYPGKAYIEINGQLYNHTDLPQTFLWWANPAVSVNEHTYSVFPPDVNAVMDHGKRAVSTFPIATGEYYKQDYSAGVDISRYKNIKVPTSYMAAHSDFDFIGNYDESIEAGLLHVADHHISPGKKQWTWGKGDFGKTWDRNLTDSDGPYIELMTGVFTDNQPDFTWLKPHEEKTFTQYFMPYKKIGRVSNATKEAALSFTQESDTKALLMVYSTSEKDVNITITSRETGKPEVTIFEETASLSPIKHFETKVNFNVPFESLTVSVFHNKNVILKYKVYVPKPQPVPSPAKAMDIPERIKSVEELWLCGMHLEQYRHATREPMDYYEEGLRREPYDIRINNSVGTLLYRRGRFEEAIPYFERAIMRQTEKNPNPYFGESYLGYGLALSMSNRKDEAYDAFYKATWSSETQGPAFYQLGCLATQKGKLGDAVIFAEKSMVRNWHDVKARLLKLAAMRCLGLVNSALLTESLAIDPLFMGFHYEAYLSGLEKEDDFLRIMHEDANNYIELATDYMNGGFNKDALNILSLYGRNTKSVHPMISYYKAYNMLCISSGKESEEALNYVREAESAAFDAIFPNKLIDITVLSQIILLSAETPLAHYLAGNLFYDKKQYEKAKDYWETAIKLKPDFALSARNLAIYYYNKEHNTSKALEYMYKAVELDNEYPRFLLELDQLRKKSGDSDLDRLNYLSKREDIVELRDDLFLRYINLQNNAGLYAKALTGLSNRTFHPWEGGEGKVIAEYKRALIGLAKEEIASGNTINAINHLNASFEYPDNLGEGKLPNVNDHETLYWLGVAYKAAGDKEKSIEFFKKATVGSLVPSPVLYYNDQPSDYIYYIGLSYIALGESDAAKKAFNQLVAYSNRHMFDKAEYDYFAVSLPEIEVFEENIQLNNDNYCKLLKELGEDGLSRLES